MSEIRIYHEFSRVRVLTLGSCQLPTKDQATRSEQDHNQNQQGDDSVLWLSGVERQRKRQWEKNRICNHADTPRQYCGPYAQECARQSRHTTPYYSARMCALVAVTDISH